MKNFFIRTCLLCIFTLSANPVFSLTITDSSSFKESLNGGAIITDSAADPNTFSNEFWVYGDSASLISNQDINPPRDLLLGEIPYLNLDGFDYFYFVYDLQETGQAGSKLVWIDDIVITSGTKTIWDFDQGTYGSIILNETTPFSDTPLGDGGDLALYLPLSLFSGLTPESEIIFSARQSNSDNGKDEWVITGVGLFILDTIDPVVPTTPVPEPSTFLLLGAGLAGLGFLVRRRKKE